MIASKIRMINRDLLDAVGDLDDFRFQFSKSSHVYSNSSHSLYRKYGWLSYVRSRARLEQSQRAAGTGRASVREGAPEQDGRDDHDQVRLVHILHCRTTPLM